MHERVAAGTLLGRWDALLRADQLNAARKAGDAFAGFEEAPITFAPTYKYVPGTGTYDGRKRSAKKKRAPAWCDRVLWRVRDRADAADSRAAGVAPPVECVRYARAELTTSDHKPVGCVPVKDFAEHFYHIGAQSGGTNPHRDPQLRRSDLSAFVLGGRE